MVLLIAVILGYTAMGIALVNRIHARAWHQGALRVIRHLHDAFLLGIPGMLVLGAGLLGPQLLLGGSWRQVPVEWWLVFVPGLIGSILLAAVICGRCLVRHPRQLLSTTHHTLDMVQEFGSRPIAPGPYFFMARLPGNGQFEVDICEKTIQVPGLPANWDGFTIWHLSDWHFVGTIQRRYFERVVQEIARHPADLLCFTGDLIDDLACLDWLPTTLGRLEAPCGRLFILGNHDWDQDANQIRAAMVEHGWTNVAAQVRTISARGTVCAVGGDETPWMGTPPDFTAAPPHEFRLLLSHTPDNFRAAQRQQVQLMLAGHTHGGQVRLPLIGPVYSPSQFGGRYASGTFFEGGTLMHVSRGLAGIHPLRWRSPPEVTRLVLKAEVKTVPLVVVPQPEA